MHVSIFSLLSLISMAVSAPTTETCRPCTEMKVARYDDLLFSEPAPSPIPPHYFGLNYTLFQVDQYDGFIPPTSGNQWTMAYGGSGNISIPSDAYVSSTLSICLHVDIHQPSKANFHSRVFLIRMCSGRTASRMRNQHLGLEIDRQDHQARHFFSTAGPGTLR